MEGFRFECLIATLRERPNGYVADALSHDGDVRLRFWGKTKRVDLLNLVEVSGLKKTESGLYMVKEFTLLDRFDELRSSFYRLAASLLMVEVSLKSHSGLRTLLLYLNKMKTEGIHDTLIGFFLEFLRENGIFDIGAMKRGALDLLNRFESGVPLDKNEKKRLLVELSKLVESYIGSRLSNITVFV